MSPITFSHKLKTVCQLLKRRYVLTSLVVLFFVVLASQLEKLTNHVFKMNEPIITGNTFHLPSSDFFEKPVPESFKKQQSVLGPEHDPYAIRGRRIADVVKAPENLHRAQKIAPQADKAALQAQKVAPQADEVAIQANKVAHKVAPQAKPMGKPLMPRRPQQPHPNSEERLNTKVKEEHGPLMPNDNKDEPTFAAKMIIASRQRHYSRRYQHENVPDTVYKTLHDITHICPEGDPPIKFSKWFNTFCWFENNCGCHEEPSMIRCLPKFHLIGFPKAGTTDLFRRIMKHPQVLINKKETNYWSVTRFIELGNETELLRGNDTTALFTEDHVINLENASVITKGIEPYLDFYNNAMEEIEEEHGGIHGKERTPSKKVLGEGSVTYAYSSLGLRISIGRILNKSPMEVDCNIPKVIRYITPDAKIIVLLRNPVERLYSDYRNLFSALPAANKTAPDFHKRVVNRIEMWKKCVSQNSEDYCVNSPQFEAVAVHSAIIGLVRSMYVIHLQKWLKEFPRNQIFMVHFEERVAEPDRTIKEIVDFLELEPLPAKQLSEIANEHIPMYEGGKGRPHQAGYGKGPMWESTRTILEDFYRPYNERLAELLQDEKYLWYDSNNPFKVPQKKFT